MDVDDDEPDNEDVEGITHYTEVIKYTGIVFRDGGTKEIGKSQRGRSQQTLDQ